MRNRWRAHGSGVFVHMHPDVDVHARHANGTLRNELLKREIFYAIPSYGLSGLIAFGTIVSPQSSESAWGDFSMPGAHRPKRDSIGRM